MTTGPDYTHGHPDLVFACPECDRAGQLNKREDGTVRCYECGWSGVPGDVVQRGNRRGENLGEEEARKGGLNSPDRPAEYYRKIGKKGGRPLDVDPRADD